MSTTTELQEVRDYPRDEDPLQVALWRDQTLRLDEHLTLLHTPWNDSNVPAAQLSVRRAAKALQDALQTYKDALRDLDRVRTNAARYAGPEYLHNL
jgi:hypothetical protein